MVKGMRSFVGEGAQRFSRSKLRKRSVKKVISQTSKDTRFRACGNRANLSAGGAAIAPNGLGPRLFLSQPRQIHDNSQVFRFRIGSSSPMRLGAVPHQGRQPDVHSYSSGRWANFKQS